MPDQNPMTHTERVFAGKPNRADLLLAILEHATPEERAAYAAALDGDEWFTAMVLFHGQRDEDDAAIGLIRLVHRFPEMADRAVRKMKALSAGEPGTSRMGIGFGDTADKVEYAIAEAREIGRLGAVVNTATDRPPRKSSTDA